MIETVYAVLPEVYITSWQLLLSSETEEKRLRDLSFATPQSLDNASCSFRYQLLIPHTAPLGYSSGLEAYSDILQSLNRSVFSGQFDEILADTGDVYYAPYDNPLQGVVSSRLLVFSVPLISSLTSGQQSNYSSSGPDDNETDLSIVAIIGITIGGLAVFLCLLNLLNTLRKRSEPFSETQALPSYTNVSSVPVTSMETIDIDDRDVMMLELQPSKLSSKYQQGGSVDSDEDQKESEEGKADLAAVPTESSLPLAMPVAKEKRVKITEVILV